MLICFCDKCGTRIPQAELDGGKARRLEGENHALCAKCAGGRSSGKTAEVRTEPSSRRDTKIGLAPARRDSKANIPAMQPAPASARGTRAVALPPSPAPAPGNRMVLFIGLGVGAFVLLMVLVLVLVMSSSEETKPSKPVATNTQPPVTPDQPKDTPPTPAPTPVEPAVAPPTQPGPGDDPRANVADSLLLQARKFFKDHPDDALGYKEKLERLVSTYQRTAAADEAQKILAELKVEPDANLPKEEAWKDAVNLLTLAEPERDSLGDGKWTRRQDRLVSPKAKMHRLALPYVPPEEYDVRVSFTRKDSSECFVVDLVRNGQPFTWMVAGWGNNVLGFSMVQGKGAKDNPYSLKRPNMLENGRRYTAILQVRSDVVRAYLDGRLASECKVPASEFSPHATWSVSKSDILGVGANDCVYEVHQLEVLELKGKGQVLNATEMAAKLAAGPSIASATTPTTTPTTPAPATPPVDPQLAGKIAYAKFLAGLQALLCQKGWSLARARVEEAAKDPLLASNAETIKLDGECLALAEKAYAAVPQGAAKLTDGTAFTLEQMDGKKQEVGKGTKTTVKKTDGESIQIEQDIGGGRLTVAVPFSKLTPATWFNLARLGLPADGEGKLALALMRFADLRGRNPAQAEKDYRGCLEQAEKEGAPAAKVARARAWQEALEREAAAEQAYREIEALAADKKNQEALGAIEAFRKNHGTTACAAGMEATLAETVMVLSQVLLKPGLYACYWSGDDKNRFKKFHLGRPEQKLKIDWALGSPDKSVPADNFGGRFFGILRVPADGTYGFAQSADDYITCWLDGKEARKGNGNYEKQLTKGDHSIKLEYFEGKGSASMNFRWKPPGAADFQDIPISVLWHDPSKIESYQKQ